MKQPADQKRVTRRVVYMLFAAASAIGLAWNSQQTGHMTALSPAAAPVQAQSDLVIQSLSVSPTSGPAGSSVTVNLTIRNQGSGTASASTTNIRLATSSSNVTTSDPLLASVSTPSISPGATNTINRTVTIPSGTSAGTRYIWVILDVNSTANQSNESNDKANRSFNVTAVTPAITSVSPNPVTGSNSAQPFTINGSGFTSQSTVTLRDKTTGEVFPNRAISSQTSSRIVINPVFTTAAHTWSVEVLNGTLSSGQFTFQVVSPATAPTISSVSPNPVTGSNSSQAFTINGSGFTSSSTVTLRDKSTGEVFPNRAISSQTSTRIVINPVFTTAAHTWSVQVLNGTLASNEFTFQVVSPEVPPTISSVSPNPVTGSNSAQQFTINGSGFTSQSTVTLRDKTTGEVFPNRTISSRTSTQIVINPIFTTAAHTWSVEVINGTLSSGQFTFQVIAPAVAPTITSVSPNPVTGSNTSQQFTINGTGFTSSSTVTLRDKTTSEVFPDRAVSSRTSTQLVVNPIFTTAAHTWSVEVLNGTLSSGQFTFQVVSPTAVTDGATFVSETVVDGTTITAGQAFTKSWTIRNSGTTTWNSGYRLRWVSGANLSNHADRFISGTVAPGASYTFSLPMTAPSSSGTFREDWKLVNGSGATIPISGSTTISVSINVPGTVAGPFISGIEPTSVISGQLTTLVITGGNFQPNFTAEVTSPAGTFPILSGGRTFVSNSQVKVQVQMGGTPPYSASLRIKNPDLQSSTRDFQVVAPSQPPATSPLRVIGIEVTQGIQDLDSTNNLLVQDRPTYIRVHVKSTSGTVENVSGELIGRRGGTYLGSLANINEGNFLGFTRRLSDIDVKQAPSRFELNDSFLFRLPPAWLNGALELEFKGISHQFSCTDAAGTCNTVRVTFVKVPKVEVRIFRIIWTGFTGIVHRPSDDDLQKVIRELKSTLPISELEVTISDLDVTTRGTSVSVEGRPSLAYVLTQLSLMRHLDGCLNKGTVQCKLHYLGILIDPDPNPLHDRVLGQGMTPGYVAAAYTGNIPFDNMAGDFAPTHEFYHNFGRQHSGCAPEYNDEHYPYSSARISEDLSDRGFFGFDINTRKIYPPGSHDIMSYCSAPKWPSDYTYNGGMQYLIDTHAASLALSNVVEQERGVTLASAGDTVLSVTGRVSTTENTGEITSVYSVASPTAVTVPATGAYTIRLEGGQGQELASFSFEPEASSDGTTKVFSLFLPVQPNTAKIVLLNNGQPIASRTVSAHAPALTLLFPNGGDTLSGPTATLRWSASDPDGDALTYLVQYSADAGSTWQTVVTDLAATSYDLNLDSVSGTSRGLIRVLASDGYNTSQAQSQMTFSVNYHAPQVSIRAPENDSAFYGDQVINLDGSAFDVDSGQISDDAISWTSSLDGVLGGGRSIAVNVASLTEGTHVITLNAQDGEGNIGTSSINLVVSRARPTLPASLSTAPNAFIFSIGMGSTQTAPETLAIRNNGDGSLNWTARADQPWIRIGSASGTAPANLGVSADTTGLAVGRYTGQVIVTTSDAPNSPQSINVSLEVVAGQTIQFGLSAYAVVENVGTATVTITRGGDLSSATTVTYTTGDTAVLGDCGVFRGAASSRCDYITTVGTLRFEAGQGSKTISIPIVDDAYAEGSENFSVTLSNPIGASLGVPLTATVTINDNEAVSGANTIDQSAAFVREHYIDFLNREPDANGLAFWTGEIEGCGSNQQCREVKRINVSAAFFLSIEFQETGYLVYRTYKSAYGDSTSPNVPGSVPAIRLQEFLPDTQRIGQGVQVGIGSWEQQLEANKQAFALEFVQRQRFLSVFPASLAPAEFVDKLNQNSGLVLTTVEREQLVTELMGSSDVAVGRASVLRKVAENPILRQRELARAFVLMQYYGYLRRNPDDLPDADFRGWKFWLDKLNQFNGNFVQAEMVKAFISSTEYRQRFGQP
jgi:hypothetical protein